ncbi:ATPase [Piscinibacter gummiphilus]|uniref:ATPase n=2 Tax=Piscinibacter gummiphilus TaxID=946333 RepID=A0A1W6L323_9BURK|nr:ATPase [Piscinibacter gummiphilus]ATU63331.1 ATP-binding protein [Piscinibacter gummiphilus]
MLEALRGLGYSTGAALADIVDNSISAKASQVDIVFAWAGSKSSVSVLDDGRGMHDEELQSAMTLGDKSPLDTRDAGDLGRFGMGLKTASLSQCRRLTVGTARDGAHSCLRWDLDELMKDPTGGWLLFEGPAAGSDSHFNALAEKEHGTLVLWEEMDRIVTQGYTSADYLDLIDSVEAHLAMVFHRLLDGPKPRLRLTINGKLVEPWDPFMMGHPAKTWNSPVERFRSDSGVVAVECHVLPHKDKLSPGDFSRGAGESGWNAQQGFYVYRNERLLVAGGWLGLGQGRAWNREEAFRLARIRLDIPNTADADWKIDIRKSTARVPVSIRPWLTRFAEDTRDRARKVFAFRGAPIAPRGSAPIEMAWRTDHGSSGARFRIDEKHPAVAAVLDACADQGELIRAMLRVLEETVPVQRIWLDTAENKTTPRTGFSGETDESVSKVLRTLYNDMVGRKGMGAELARKALLSTEPFQNYPALVERLGDEASTQAAS